MEAIGATQNPGATDDELLGVSQTIEAPASEMAVRSRRSTDPEVPVHPGEELDHFTIEREIGRGGMGVVYVAHDRALDRRVALKVVLPRRGDDLALERFFREARAQAKLASPYVVPIHFIGRAGPAAYFAMELVPGEALEAGLERGERLDPERARRLMIDVARGLASAQTAGFIHRDIKPSNLLLDEAGHVKIADFGLAKPLSGAGTLTGEGVVLGTPMYMAPEQTRGGAVDHRADMYALGCSFFHLIAGAPPYDGSNAIDLLAKHFTSPVPNIRVTVRDVPPALGRVLERLMQKEPEARFASYDELIAALEAAAPGSVEPAGFAIRAVAALMDLGIGAAIVGFTGPIGAVSYLALLVALHAKTGQTLGKYLLRIRAERLSGGMLGPARALARVTLAAWLPVLVAAVVLATSGHDDLFAILGHASQVGHIQALVTAFAVGNVVLSVLYAACLGLAAIHPEKRAVHDLLAGSRVVHVRSSP
jgi:eukaryotic-like serine/threonine-protein kinase